MEISEAQGFAEQIKKNYIFALRSGLGVIAFWFALFAILSIARSISGTWLAVIANFSDADSALAATSALVIGLGGTVIIGAGDPGSIVFSAAFLFIVIPIALYYTLRAFHKGKQSKVSSAVTAGSYSALGSVLSLLAIVFFASGTFAETGISLGFVSLVPFVVTAFMGFASIPNAVASTVLSRLSNAGTTFNHAFRGTIKFLIAILVAAASYAALIMGTGLIASLEIWIWVVAALAAVLVLPTVGVLVIPIYLGSLTPIYLELSKFYPQFKSDYEWVSWAILIVAWIAVLVSAVRSANRGNIGSDLWFRHGLINLGVGALLTWLGSFRIKSDFPLDWVNSYSSVASNHSLMTIGLITLAGVLFGLLAHPKAKKLNHLLSTLGKIIRNVIDAALYIFALRWVTTLNHLKKKYRDLSYLLQKTIKYSLVSSLVSVFFVVGQALVPITGPLYDSENYADSKFVFALENGDASNLKDLTKSLGYTVLSSNGLGSETDLQVVDPQELLYEKEKAAREKRRARVEKTGEKFTEAETNKPAEQNLRQITWQKGAYFIQLDYDRSTSKNAFWGIIPQWDVRVTDLKMPEISLFNGSAPLKVLQVNGKAYFVDDVILLPGKVTLQAGTDATNFLTSNKVEVDLSKDNSAKFIIGLDTTKSVAIHREIETAMAAEYSGCTKFQYTALDEPALGAIDSSTGLPKLVAKARGVCTDENYGDLPFRVKSTGSYSVSNKTWTWTYEF